MIVTVAFVTGFPADFTSPNTLFSLWNLGSDCRTPLVLLSCFDFIESALSLEVPHPLVTQITSESSVMLQRMFRCIRLSPSSPTFYSGPHWGKDKRGPLTMLKGHKLCQFLGVRRKGIQRKRAR